MAGACHVWLICANNKLISAPQPAPAPISAAVSDKPQSSQPSPVVQPVVVASDDDIDDEDDTKETDPGSPKDPAYDTDEVLMDSFNAFSLGSKGKVNFSEVFRARLFCS